METLWMIRGMTNTHKRYELFNNNDSAGRFVIEECRRRVIDNFKDDKVPWVVDKAVRLTSRVPRPTGSWCIARQTRPCLVDLSYGPPSPVYTAPIYDQETDIRITACRIVCSSPGGGATHSQWMSWYLPRGPGPTVTPSGLFRTVAPLKVELMIEFPGQAVWV